MAGSGFIAAAVNTAAAHPWSLVVGGLDVIAEAGSPGNRLGTPIDTIRVTEAGPGGVSALVATVNDPAAAFAVAEGTEVSYWDLANNVCLFRGEVTNYGSDPRVGGQGREVSIECTGVEALLDWAIVPPGVQIANGVRIPHNIGLMAQRFEPRLKAPSQPSGMASAPFTRSGTFSFPIGSMARPAEPSLATQFATAVSVAGTLRQVIGQILELGSWLDLGTGAFPGEPVAALVTVDFYYGLRVWEDDPSLQPDDYTTLTIVDTHAGPIRADGLSVRVDWSGVFRSVTVVGLAGTVYGPFSDGSGIRGRGGLINDTTITTEDVARTRGVGLMAQVRATSRGSFSLEDWTPPTTVHAGSLVSITDAATGLATTHRIMQIDKSFLPSGRQTWRVTFGGLAAPSLTRLIRRLTRESLN